MTLSARARITAYLLACLVASASVLVANTPARSTEADWRGALQHADAALTGGDARGAGLAWAEAYRAAMRVRTPEGLLAVGHAYLRIGAATRDSQSAMAEARRIFLTALFQARERGDAVDVARVGEAFATLGDREVAHRAFQIAAALSTAGRDDTMEERVALPAAAPVRGRIVR